MGAALACCRPSLFSGESVDDANWRADELRKAARDALATLKKGSGESACLGRDLAKERAVFTLEAALARAELLELGSASDSDTNLYSIHLGHANRAAGAFGRGSGSGSLPESGGKSFVGNLFSFSGASFIGGGRSKRTSQDLVRQVFPRHVAGKLLKDNFNIITDFHSSVSIVFADIKGFTKWSSSKTPEQVIDCLSTYFQLLDMKAESLGVYKVETVGDGYVAVANAPVPVAGNHAALAVEFALAIADFTPHLREIMNDENLDVRVGVHSGSIVSGVIRSDRPRWQLFGDTINYASRMESLCEPGRVQISKETQAMLAEDDASREDFTIIPRGCIEVKGKGLCETFYVAHRDADEADDSQESSPQTLAPVRHLERSDSKGSSGSGKTLARTRSASDFDSGIDATLWDVHDAAGSGIEANLSFTMSPPFQSSDDYDADNDGAAVLVVEDSMSLMLYISRILKKNGYDVKMAKHGLTAMKMVVEEHFAAILCDLSMPVMDGRTFVQKFRSAEAKALKTNARFRRVPVLALTAEELDDGKVEALLGMGFDEVLDKGCRKKHLLDTLKSHITRA